jgi:ubiquinone/menaquinone biosynthesis C-methylase UbiE
MKKTHFDQLRSHMPHLDNITLLDLGSGRGDFLIEATKKGLDVIGLEKSEEYIQITKEKAARENVSIKVISGVGEKMPFDNNSFDFINMAEVIEHVESPLSVLKEVHRVLKPNARAYMSVPNRFGIYDPHFHLYFVNWLPRSLCNLYISFFKKHKNYESKTTGHQNLREMHYYTRGQISRLVKSLGFSIKDGREKKIANKYPHKLLLTPALIAYRLISIVHPSTFHFLIKKESVE